MTEQPCESWCLKVVAVGKDGKRRFDPQTKQWLVEACLERGASVARLARKHGVDANVLRKWIKRHREQLAEAATPRADSAFVPVVMVRGEQAEPVRVEPKLKSALSSSPMLTVQMPNGISLKLECGSHDTALLSAMIETLGRCDVSTRRLTEGLCASRRRRFS
jgi:transposase